MLILWPCDRNNDGQILFVEFCDWVIKQHLCTQDECVFQPLLESPKEICSSLATSIKRSCEKLLVILNIKDLEIE